MGSRRDVVYCSGGRLVMKANGWFPKEFISPKKPLSFALGYLLESPSMGPDSGFTRDIYMPAEILSSASQSKDVWTRGISTVKDV
ncbi:hypothetical protein NC651_009815 [Populus alba x Populus x berolinensis]|nr:hypothetical protein NC651_009815 [Populus alba x Populus x berolinensis]